MPVVHSVVPEADSCIYMPVLQQVGHHLLNALNVTQYIKDNIYIETGWTAPKGTRKNHTFFTRTNTLRIQAEQVGYNNPVFDFQSFQFAAGNGFTDHTTTTHLYPLISDTTSEIYLHESILPCSFNLNCTLWFNSRNVAYETLKKMMFRFANGHMYSLSLTYDYPVPKDIVAVIFKLFKNRKFDKQDANFKDLIPLPEGKTITFADWLSRVAHVRFVSLKHRARADKELCISKVIDNALIQVDCDTGKPEEVKVNNVPEVYTIPFTVKLQFEEASALVCKYPCIVDNTQLSDLFIPVTRRNDTPIASQFPKNANPLWDGVYHTHSAVHQFATGEVRVPYYDDWKIPWNELTSRSYRYFFVSLFQADADGDYLTLDLTQRLVEDYCLSPFVLEIYKYQLNETFKDDVIFNITSYSRDKVQAKSDLKMSKDLVLTIKAKDIHPQRHLVFYQMTNFMFLNPRWHWILRKYPWEFGFDPVNNPNHARYLDHITNWMGPPSWGNDINANGVFYGPSRTVRIFNAALIPKYPFTRNGGKRIR